MPGDAHHRDGSGRAPPARRCGSSGLPSSAEDTSEPNTVFGTAVIVAVNDWFKSWIREMRVDGDVECDAKPCVLVASVSLWTRPVLLSKPFVISEKLRVLRGRATRPPKQSARDAIFLALYERYELNHQYCPERRAHRWNGSQHVLLHRQVMIEPNSRDLSRG